MALTKEEIIKKADDILAHRKFVNKCLQAMICPEDGNELTILHEYGDFDIIVCSKCKKEYNIYY
jgi:hypothetical protein